VSDYSKSLRGGMWGGPFLARKIENYVAERGVIGINFREKGPASGAEGKDLQRKTGGRLYRKGSSRGCAISSFVEVSATGRGLGEKYCSKREGEFIRGRKQRQRTLPSLGLFEAWGLEGWGRPWEGLGRLWETQEGSRGGLGGRHKCLTLMTPDPKLKRGSEGRENRNKRDDKLLVKN